MGILLQADLAPQSYEPVLLQETTAHCSWHPLWNLCEVSVSLSKVTGGLGKTQLLLGVEQAYVHFFILPLLRGLGTGCISKTMGWSCYPPQNRGLLWHQKRCSESKTADSLSKGGKIPLLIIRLNPWNSCHVWRDKVQFGKQKGRKQILSYW